MNCPNCGYTNQPGNRFCVRCGIDTAAYRGPEQEPATAATLPDAPPPPPPPPQAPAPPSPWGVPSTGAAPPPAPVPGPMPPPGAPGSPTGAPNPFAPPPPPPGYPQWGYGQYPPPYPPSGQWGMKSTNGLAVASLVLGLAGWIVCGVGSVLAIIFGFIAQGQIRQSQGRQGGEGMAKAGIILGFIGVVLLAVYIVIVAVSASNQT